LVGISKEAILSFIFIFFILSDNFVHGLDDKYIQKKDRPKEAIFFELKLYEY